MIQNALRLVVRCREPVSAISLGHDQKATEAIIKAQMDFTKPPVAVQLGFVKANGNAGVAPRLVGEEKLVEFDREDPKALNDAITQKLNTALLVQALLCKHVRPLYYTQNMVFPQKMQGNC